MESTKLMELSPDRSLLNAKFDGYKLSATKIESFKQQFESPVNWRVPNSNQYSLLHGQLFGFHNHLISEFCEETGKEILYFFDKSGKVNKYYFDVVDNKFKCTSVWQVPLEQNENSYNMSLKFCSKDKAVLADGSGFLFLLETGCRTKDNREWKLLYKEEPIVGKNFVIFDAMKSTDSNRNDLHLLLVNIDKIGDDEKYFTIIYWVTLRKIDETWGQVALKQLKTKSFPQYLHFERDSSDFIYFTGDSECQFILDSENKIEKCENTKNSDQKKYFWTQTDEDLTVKLNFNDDSITKSDFCVENQTNSTEICIKCKNETVLNGNLYKLLSSDLTTFTFDGETLEILLIKNEKGTIWPELILGDNSGEYQPSPAQINEANEMTAHLTGDAEEVPASGTTFTSQPVEDCDFESDTFNFFERICCKTHKVTHKINLGSHQILVNVDIDRNRSLAFGVRNDVDVCVYQPQMIDGEFSVLHKGTLLAMGYIQASKETKKFFVAPPNLSYSAICESNHLFIYNQDKPVTSGELRNRVTGAKVGAVSQQQVFNIQDEEILGIYAGNTNIYLLGSNFIVALKL